MIVFARTIYFKRTKATGESSIESARVWSAEKYLTQLKKDTAEQAQRDGIVADKIEAATEDEYRKARGFK